MLRWPDLAGDAIQSSGKVKTAHSDAMPRSTCVPRAINGASVSAANAPDTRTAFPSGRHSPSNRLTKLSRDDRREIQTIGGANIAPQYLAEVQGGAKGQRRQPLLISLFIQMRHSGPRTLHAEQHRWRREALLRRPERSPIPRRR